MASGTAQRCAVEPLEGRQLFAVNAGVYDTLPGAETPGPTTCRVTGDDANDSIAITATALNDGTGRSSYAITATGYTGPTPLIARDLVVYGYGGDDEITLTGNVRTAYVSGNSGSDTVHLVNCVSVTVVPLSSSDYTIGYTDAADTFTLDTCRACSVNGGDGDDHFTTSANCDDVRLYGGAGADVFSSSGILKDSYIYGDGGADVVISTADSGGSQFFGGADNDRADFRNATGNVGLYGDDGNDFLFGGPGDDYLEGGAGNDWLAAGAGDDILNSVDGVVGNDFVKGEGNNAFGDEAYVDGDQLANEATLNTVEIIHYMG
jgi:Ca2+-binding RTX toxin-like protein